jgi:hypothetical protein
MAGIKTFSQFAKVNQIDKEENPRAYNLAKKAWDTQESKLIRLTNILSEAHFNFKKIIGPEIQGLPLHKDRASQMVRKIEGALKP